MTDSQTAADMKKQELEAVIREIDSVWGRHPVPEGGRLLAAGLPEHEHASKLDPSRVKEWLAGKRYDQIENSDEIQIEQPFVWLSGGASVYYFAGYARQVIGDLIDYGSEEIPELSDIVLLDYLASNKLIDDSKAATKGQLKVMVDVMNCVKREKLSERVWLKGEEASGFECNLRVLVERLRE